MGLGYKVNPVYYKTGPEYETEIESGRGAGVYVWLVRVVY